MTNLLLVLACVATAALLVAWFAFLGKLAALAVLEARDD